MRAPKTITLLALSLILLVNAGFLMRPVVVLRPIRTGTGEVVQNLDGRPLMETDTVGEIRVNWDAYSCMFGSVVLFVWSFARVGRGLYLRHRAHKIKNEIHVA
jgi:hypothetical protein